MKEINFDSLKSDFDAVCNQVNEDKEVLTLTLKSNRKVYIMPEENYDSIQTFFVTGINTNSRVSL